MDLTLLHEVLRATAEGLLAPVIVVLLLFMAVTLVMLGSLVVEALSEFRRLKSALPELALKLRDATNLAETVENSRILRRQKSVLLDLITTPGLTPALRESFAVRAVERERANYDRITWVTDVIARLGPAFGLIATLIPLGPGVVALGAGDTATLSAAMLTAFDATVAGLISSGLSFIVSGVRKRMYAGYLASFELVVECVLEQTTASAELELPAGIKPGSLS